TAMEFDDVGFYAADYLIKAYPDVLKDRFKLDEIAETEIEFLEDAARKRGAIMTGGRVNLHKICEILLTELQAGKLGRITLETPAMLEKEKIEIAEAEAKKAAKKAARKQRFKDGSATPDKHDRKEKRNEKRAAQSKRMRKS
ncbi:MAG: ribosome biogenesis GTPase YlqF, partial [Pseudomonadota bacterium]|nr:ribosome biogenesis GTPase YlqF [Pseudomonadota bacterium]